jgi:hypothetical protein
MGYVGISKIVKYDTEKQQEHALEHAIMLNTKEFESAIGPFNGCYPTNQPEAIEPLTKLQFEDAAGSANTSIAARIYDPKMVETNNLLVQVPVDVPFTGNTTKELVGMLNDEQVNRLTHNGTWVISRVHLVVKCNGFFTLKVITQHVKSGAKVNSLGVHTVFFDE